MNKLIIALMLVSANSFADLQYDLDKMEQERRVYQLEQQMQDMEIKHSNDNAYKFYDELHDKITRVGD